MQPTQPIVAGGDASGSVSTTHSFGAFATMGHNMHVWLANYDDAADGAIDYTMTVTVPYTPPN